MKNTVIILTILILPIIAFYSLKVLKLQVNAAPFKNEDYRPKIIKFASPMCSDCVKMQKIFKNLTPKYDKAINFVYISVESSDKKSLDLAQKHKVAIVPTIIIFDNAGKEIERIEGFIEELVLDKKFKALTDD